MDPLWIPIRKKILFFQKMQVLVRGLVDKNSTLLSSLDLCLICSFSETEKIFDNVIAQSGGNDEDHWVHVPGSYKVELKKKDKGSGESATWAINPRKCRPQARNHDVDSIEGIQRKGKQAVRNNRNKGPTTSKVEFYHGCNILLGIDEVRREDIKKGLREGLLS